MNMLDYFCQMALYIKIVLQYPFELSKKLWYNAQDVERNQGQLYMPSHYNPN
jgi:hypothetical protein